MSHRDHDNFLRLIGRAVPWRLVVALTLGLSFPTFAGSLKCPCIVINVLSGDTVFVLDQYRSSRKIWLAGIDAPDMDEMLGLKSRQNLIDLVANQHVDVEFEQRDRYGRIIGRLLKAGQDINLQQLKDGFAKRYKAGTRELSDSDNDLYDLAEASARKRQVGLWSPLLTGS
jgi:endonuclease YncB( thermonuclease family)